MKFRKKADANLNNNSSKYRHCCSYNFAINVSHSEVTTGFDNKLNEAQKNVAKYWNEKNYLIRKLQ